MLTISNITSKRQKNHECIYNYGVVSLCHINFVSFLETVDTI